eukprot:TRINITY_DN48190_c0_g1_i1.p1 TRINITY_DN48190_c0_g1~~TRINITY_DN48190_c0_g1_i1.p1  ORF type:complete len:450 (+),score=62.52 TRINITY_DN48190_c0_g1_i1:169-1350(+)
MWKQYLPRVEPHYAVKCNPDSALIKVLSHLGVKFDCASQEEIDHVLKLCPNRSASSDIIYANPCKQKSHLHFARRAGVKRMTVDNYQELVKIKEVYPDAEILIRIMPDDSKSLCQLSCKYGLPITRLRILLESALKLELSVVGIAFHVGSGCYAVSAFTDAVKLAKKAFQIGEEMGLQFSVLDIGGGFPGYDAPNELSFREIANAMRPLLDTFFSPEIQIIAEPGRYFSAGVSTLVTNVVARRDLADEDIVPRSYDSPSVQSSDSESVDDFTKPPSTDHLLPNTQDKLCYYINDGVYGSFNCIMFDHVSPTPFWNSEYNALPQYPSTIFGPTCDGLDCVCKEIMMPKLSIGTWIYWSNMGAYTNAASSRFNGFRKPKIHYIFSEKVDVPIDLF